jgi:hypothetical protein
VTDGSVSSASTSPVADALRRHDTEPSGFPRSGWTRSVPHAWSPTWSPHEQLLLTRGGAARRGESSGAALCTGGRSAASPAARPDGELSHKAVIIEVCGIVARTLSHLRCGDVHLAAEDVSLSRSPGVRRRRVGGSARPVVDDVISAIHGWALLSPASVARVWNWWAGVRKRPLAAIRTPSSLLAACRSSPFVAVKNGDVAAGHPRTMWHPGASFRRDAAGCRNRHDHTGGLCSRHAQ